MHIQTHILSGWCLGNLFGLGKRERSLAIIAGSIYDLDGLGIIFGPVAYWKYHHLLGHNLLAGLLVCAVLCWFSKERVKGFIAYLALFHIHLAADYFSSGQEWVIYYLWPFSRLGFENASGWDFYSWQNIGTGFFFIGWTVFIIFKNKRTFFESVMPNLDRQIVQLSEKITKKIRGTIYCEGDSNEQR